MSIMRQIAAFVSVLACSLFTGAGVYSNLVEHPARMECGRELAATEFAPSYRRATATQASLAAVGLLALPTNKPLLNPALDRRSAETEGYSHAGSDCMP